LNGFAGIYRSMKLGGRGSTRLELKNDAF
jgi:hypothetical protein